MYLIAIAWAYVALMMAAAEALSPQGTVFGAIITLMLYGILPLGLLLYILGTLVFEVAFGLLMAVLLDSDRRGFALMRGLFFSPMVLSMSAAGVLWTVSGSPQAVEDVAGALPG